MKASELITLLQGYVDEYGDHPVAGSVGETKVADIFLIDTDGEFTDFDAKPDTKVREYWLSA
ncbi:MAG: hypothetical protein AB3N12_01595 [Ruegeria sp.]